jgi:hypothetical protein
VDAIVAATSAPPVAALKRLKPRRGGPEVARAIPDNDTIEKPARQLRCAIMCTWLVKDAFWKISRARQTGCRIRSVAAIALPERPGNAGWYVNCRLR